MTMTEINDHTPIKAGDLVPVTSRRHGNFGQTFVYRAEPYHGSCRDHCDLYDGKRCPDTCTRYVGGDDIVFKLAGPLAAFNEEDLVMTHTQRANVRMENMTEEERRREDASLRSLRSQTKKLLAQEQDKE